MKTLACLLMIAVMVPMMFGFTYTGYKWTSNPSFYIERNINSQLCLGAEEAIVKAAVAWNNVSEQSWRATRLAGYTDSHYSEIPDGVNVIGCQVFPDGRIGSTARHMRGGYIIECDVAFNTLYRWAAMAEDLCPWDRYDAQSVCAHEFGHWLRLGDSGDVAATMYGWIEEGETQMRTLSGDDVAGIRKIYGNGDSPEKPSGGCEHEPAYEPELKLGDK